MSKFWRGLIWGGILGSLAGALMSPRAKIRKKPIVKRSAEAVYETTRGLVREARRARKRLMNR